MSARTISIVESAPEDYPDIGSEYDAALQAATWQRLEGWIAWRFSPRAVVFIAEGPGAWSPPLKPATIEEIEVWRDDAWQATTLAASPIASFQLPDCTHYRFTGSVGLDLEDPADLPAAVREAADRLAAYFVGLQTSKGITMAASRMQSGDLALTFGRDWAARALQVSGAADLLRGYRNLGAA